MFELLVLVISGIVNILLGLTVYLKNPKSATSKLFLLLTSSFVLWSTVNYFSLHPFLFSQVVWVRLVLLCAALLCLAVFLTFTVFPSQTMTGSKKLRKAAITYTAFVMLLVMTPLVFTVNTSGEPAPNKGIVFFTVLVFGLLGSGILALVKKLHASTGRIRSQLGLMVFGLAATFGLIFVSNFLLVVVYDYRNLLALGPAYTLIFSGTVAYAIVKHRLFDIRTAVARSVAYILSLGFLAAVYATFSSFLVDTVLPTFSGPMVTQAANTGIFFVAVLAYPQVKKFFDRITNSLFYRDAYDSQEFLDKLNRIILTNVDVDPLLKQMGVVIEKYLKADYCMFGLRATSYQDHRIIGDYKGTFTQEDMDLMHDVAPKIHRRVIVTDEIDNIPELQTVLQKHDVAVLARLVTTLKYNVEGIGYLALGPKKSGNPYSSQDIKVIRIIASELVIAIQNALRFEEIENFNVTLQEKVDDATKRLKKANDKLKSLDETKDEFISMASHQLRTPLTSVKGYLSMVIEGDAGKLNEMQTRLLDQAFTSSQRMVYLIADLLNLSRLRTGKFVIEVHPTNLADVIEGEVGQLKETAAARSLELTYDKPDNFPVLNLDETKIRQVIMNFVDNAIYYTPAGGHIKVSVAETEQSVEFTVTDDGMGVPKAEQHHLFNKFYRAGNARKARPDGTGLGLFMAKKVIVAQGGSIIFKSEEGKGSTFGFSFGKQKLQGPVISEPPENKDN